MDALECQALLVRFGATLPQLETSDQDQRWNLLEMIVNPSPTLRDASLRAATERGISTLAYQMAASDGTRRRIRWKNEADLAA